LRDSFIAYLDGFSPNVQEILTKFKFRDQIQTLVEADILGHLISDFLNPEVNCSPKDVLNEDGRVRLPGLDNHGMGTVFEELIRRFNEENNEEAGEHFTPRDVVTLMAKLLFLPVEDPVQHLFPVRRLLRHRRHADSGRRGTAGTGEGPRQRGFHPPLWARDQPRDLRLLAPTEN